MQGTTHVAIGFLSGAVVAAGFHVPLYLQTGAVLRVASIGSLMPDIDTPASKMSKSLGDCTSRLACSRIAGLLSAQGRL